MSRVKKAFTEEINEEPDDCYWDNLYEEYIFKIMTKLKLNFSDYSEALQWVEQKAKNFKSVNEFYESDEYKSAYPLIRKMYEAEQSTFAKKGMTELKKAGLKIGDKVAYDFVSPYFNIEEYTGKIIERMGIPYVKLDVGQTTMSGKKSVRWHKGFVKVS